MCSDHDCPSCSRFPAETFRCYFVTWNTKETKAYSNSTAVFYYLGFTSVNFPAATLEPDRKVPSAKKRPAAGIPRESCEEVMRQRRGKGVNTFRQYCRLLYNIWRLPILHCMEAGSKIMSPYANSAQRNFLFSMNLRTLRTYKVLPLFLTTAINCYCSFPRHCLVFSTVAFPWQNCTSAFPQEKNLHTTVDAQPQPAAKTRYGLVPMGQYFQAVLYLIMNSLLLLAKLFSQQEV